MSEPSTSRMCPYCDGYQVDRMYLASIGMDSCQCRSCGARWDEDATATSTQRQ